MRGIRLFSLFLFSFFSFTIYAADKLIFGPEFTFPRKGELSKEDDRLARRMYHHLVLGQPKGAKFKGSIRTGRFESPSGWWISIHDDPGVKEISMSPMTVAEFRKYGKDIQDALFVSAYNEGQFPADFMGGGHINISIDYFLEKPLLLRNFIVDLINHNELSMGIFGYDTNNALPFPLFTKDAQKLVITAIKDFDRKIAEYKRQVTSNSHESQLDFEHEIDHFLYTVFCAVDFMKDPFVAYWDGDDDSLYERGAAAFIDVKENIHDRIEIRAVRPQKNINIWINQIALLQGRIKYLENLNYKIPIETKVPLLAWAKTNIKKAALNPPINPQKALRSFYEYVEESGQNWKNHRNYMWPAWIKNGELKKFESSTWFKRRQSTVCEKLLN